MVSSCTSCTAAQMPASPSRRRSKLRRSLRLDDRRSYGGRLRKSQPGASLRPWPEIPVEGLDLLDRNSLRCVAIEAQERSRHLDRLIQNRAGGRTSAVSYQSAVCGTRRKNNARRSVMRETKAIARVSAEEGKKSRDEAERPRYRKRWRLVSPARDIPERHRQWHIMVVFLRKSYIR